MVETHLPGFFFPPPAAGGGATAPSLHWRRAVTQCVRVSESVAHFGNNTQCYTQTNTFAARHGDAPPAIAAHRVATASGTGSVQQVAESRGVDSSDSEGAQGRRSCRTQGGMQLQRAQRPANTPATWASSGAYTDVTPTPGVADTDVTSGAADTDVTPTPGVADTDVILTSASYDVAAAAAARRPVGVVCCGPPATR